MASTSYLNLERGFRRSLDRQVARGPTQQEAQERKAKRERWIAQYNGGRIDALSYLPESLRP